MIAPKFYIRQGKKEESNIYVTFYINRKKINFSTKVSVLEKNWDEKKMMVKRSDINCNDKNRILEKIRSRISDVDVKYRLRDKKLTREIFIKNYNKPSDYDTFHEYCEVVMRRTRTTIEVNTVKSHKSVLKKLKEYKENLHFDDIDIEFLIAYKRYLIKDLGNNNNTASKNLAVIRKYVRAAIRDGYMETYPFSELSINRNAANIVFLDDEELKTLCHLYINGKYEEKHKSTLQFFLFMCFGSQHVGDAKMMKIEQFGERTFTYYRIKNRNSKPAPVEVPISATLRKIIDDIADGREKGYLFESLPEEQTMNRYLKVIARHAGIEKDISHRTGRHTFATIYLENNPNIRNLQEILGHSDSKTTMMYVHAMEKYKNDGVKCFDKFL